MRIAATISILLMSSFVSAQVVINEFSASNYSLGVGGDNEDFVEFYNSDATDADIGGYFLSDDPANPDKFEIPAGTVVPSGGYLLVICSAEGEIPGNLYVGGNLNTNFKVTQTAGESIVFSDDNEVLIESYTFGLDWVATQADHSWSREVDGASDWKVCTAPTPEAANGGEMYDGYAPTPTMSQVAGFYPGGVTVSFSAPAGFEIRYTDIGYEPEDWNALFDAPIVLDETRVLRARCFDPSGALAPGLTETNTYFVGDDMHEIVVVSVSGNEQENGAWPGGWGGGPDEACHLEFFRADGTYWCEAEGDSNEHGNDSNAYPQKGFDYISRDQKGYTHAVEAELFHVKNRDEFQRLIFKAAANDNYPSSGGGHIRDAYVQTLSHLADLHLDERTNESCIVYLNGEYWGVYEYREKADDVDFTLEYYDQPRHFVDYLKTWGGTWEEYGSGDDWYDLVDFCTGQDLTVAANYDYVVSELNPMSLIDYFVLNSYVVCADWLNWNTAWWRGRHPDGDAKRWRYVLWDMDNTFGHGTNYSGIPSQDPDADPCNPESLGDLGGQGHIPVLNALMENETFWATYINRWADLGNTYFTCEYMHATLDSMIAVIEPEMPRHMDRWGGNMADWQNNVQEIHDFIDERCESTLMSGMEDCYDVVPVTLTLIIDGIGEVEVNSVDISPAMTPYAGTYFEDVPVTLTALENLGFDFIFWEVVSGDLTLTNEQALEQEFSLSGDVTIIAHFENDLDPQQMVFRVEPAGAGDILLDGTAFVSYPAASLLEGGYHTLAAEGLDEWHVFTGWTTSGININPSLMSPVGSIYVLAPDTITAHFQEIVHIDLTVQVIPPGSGSVRIENDLVVTNFWSGGLEPLGPVDAYATPIDYWVFDHWEGANSNPSPDPANREVYFQVESSDTLTAYFKQEDFAMYIPTAFTPNNDGMNDAFLPVGAAFLTESYRLEVLNRWGELVFASDDPAEAWNGDHQDGLHYVSDGIYSYILAVKSPHELAPREYVGTIQVIR